MKKIIITAGLAILLIAAVITAVILTNNVNSPSEEASTSAGIETESKTAYTQKPSTDINVDSWLKISEIRSCNGRLAVVAENISDIDVEYALLTVKNENEIYTFNASALLRNTKVLLTCNEDVNYNPDAVYTLWKTENVLYFTTPPSMHDNALEMSVQNGSISVKNISGKDIASDIYVYYKLAQDGIPDGSITHRTKLAGLKDSAQTYINIPSINADNCIILFTQY